MSPSFTVWSLPAVAVGASLAPAVTVIVTVSVWVALEVSLTVSSKTRLASAASCEGAVKLGVVVVSPVRVTDGVPDDCRQEYVIASLSGSDPLPDRVTESPSFTVRSLPALAVGDWLLAVTVMVTLSVPDALRSSVTVS